MVNHSVNTLSIVKFAWPPRQLYALTIDPAGQPGLSGLGCIAMLTAVVQYALGALMGGSICATCNTRARSPRASVALPGPLEVPGLGALDFIYRYSVCGNPLGPVLLDYRIQYGQIFTMKTGPIRQVWIADESMVDEIYSMEDCSGRSQLPAAETPFGEKFLFLKRDPVAAQPIREEQQQWLKTNAGAKDVRTSVAAIEPELFAAIDAAMASGSPKGVRKQLSHPAPQHCRLSALAPPTQRSESRALPLQMGSAAWPGARVGTAMLGALLGVFGGDELEGCLSEPERAELLSSLAGNPTPNP